MLPENYAHELYHYGVLGMKWGVRRAAAKGRANVKLGQRALSYDARSAKLTKKSEKAHARYDLERFNRRATKASRYETYAAMRRKKALKVEDEIRRTRIERRAAKDEYIAARARLDANRISKSTGYGAKAMRYSVKSDIVAKKAARARMKMASNNAYIAMMDRKVSSISEDDLNGKYAFVKEYLKDRDK